MPVTITGLDPLFKKLGNCASIRTLTPPMERGVLRLQRTMQMYPPPPPQSTYRRTGTYGRRWNSRVSGSASGLTGRVGNNVPYAPFVGSSMFQTARHNRTGWRTDADAIRANEDVILADFQAAVDRALAS
jgi:hypothetical protein